MPTEHEIDVKRLELVGKLFRERHPSCVELFQYERMVAEDRDATAPMNNQELGGYLIEYMPGTFEVLSERIDPELRDWMIIRAKAECDVDDEFNYLRAGM